MNSETTTDPIGQAISNYFYSNDNTPIIVSSSVVDDEELPPEYFFRNYKNMPMLERLALKSCKGKILDVGAGAGSHTIWLQTKGFNVSALEISALCCKVMKNRGIKEVINSDILHYSDKHFDTILLLMNGIGIAGTPNGLIDLLNHLKKMLNQGGKILLDSSDLIYLYEQDDGSFMLNINAETYYGEIDYQLSYKHIIGKPFSWLFADHVFLSDIAESCGYKTKIIEYGPHYDYLAELTIM